MLDQLIEGTSRITGFSADKSEALFFDVLLALAVLAGTFLVSRVSVVFLDKALARFSNTTEQESDPGLRANLLAAARGLIRTLIAYGLWFVAFVIILQIFNYQVVHVADLRDLGIKVLKIAGILVGARMLVNLGHIVIMQVFAQKELHDALNSQRLKTLEPLAKTAVTYACFFIAVLTVLQILNVNTSAILASAGILGLAVGFGAQSLVRDIITGFFIVFENQLAVGDYVEVAGVEGVVEETGLRTCKIREWTGQLHIIPNGEIARVKNYNRGPILALVTVGIAYEEDVNRAMEVLRSECQRVAAETPGVRDAYVEGVLELADSSVNIRVIARTEPGAQWNAQRELRRRLKYALDQAGIEIPYPRVVVHQSQK